MELHELQAPAPNRKNRKRVGRGEGSGLGKQSGKGHKGQKSRGSGKVPRGFEGGQMPLQRRLPKFGFKNPFRTSYVALNLDAISKAMEKGTLGTTVTPQDLINARLADTNDRVKLLAKGTLTAKVDVHVHACSAAAKKAVEEAGGTVTLVD